MIVACIGNSCNFKRCLFSAQEQAAVAVEEYTVQGLVYFEFTRHLAIVDNFGIDSELSAIVSGNGKFGIS